MTKKSRSMKLKSSQLQLLLKWLIELRNALGHTTWTSFATAIARGNLALSSSRGAPSHEITVNNKRPRHGEDGAPPAKRMKKDLADLGTKQRRTRVSIFYQEVKYLSTRLGESDWKAVLAAGLSNNILDLNVIAQLVQGGHWLQEVKNAAIKDFVDSHKQTPVAVCGTNASISLSDYKYNRFRQEMDLDRLLPTKNDIAFVRFIEKAPLIYQ